MKRIFTYLVLYSYGILMFKPAWPVLFDTIAHLCWQYEHINVVHQHNGNYHVDQELRDEADKSQKENNNGIYKLQVSEYVHIIPDRVNECLVSILIRNNYPISSVYPPDVYRETHYPPPKSSPYLVL